MSGKKQTFGQPKPLPGQAGYNTSEADILEKDAKEMEVRLKMLQERMLQQQLADEAVLKPGGSRWGSARTDKGSIKSYAKDVQEKHKKRAAAAADPAARATAEGRRIARAAEAAAVNDFRSKDVNDWTVGDVTQWLNSVMLGQYASTFAANEITGPILLDISLEDLDYMGVSILGHRKVVLKGIEDLRQNKRVTLNLTASNANNGKYTEASKKSLDDSVSLGAGGGEAKLPSAAPTKVHWSQLEPLSASTIDPSKAGGAFVNAADGDILDEAAEQAAFRAAVAEWRSGGGQGKVSIVREWESAADKDRNGSGSGSGSSSGANADDKMWRNPFATVSSDDEDRGSKSIGEASVKPGGSRPGCLADGVLDEAAEHAEFVKAVEAWRGRGKSESPNSSSSSATEGAGTGTGTGTSTGASSASASAMAIAAKIAQQLETEQAEAERRVQAQREEAERKLSMAVKEAEEARSHKWDTDDKKSDFADDGIDAKDTYRNGIGSSSSAFTYADPPISTSRSSALIDDDGDDDEADACGDDERLYAAQAKSTVAVSLVESTLGLPDDKLADEKESYYIVEEDSDDD